MVVALLIGSPILAWRVHYPVVTPIVAIGMASPSDNASGQAQ